MTVWGTILRNKPHTPFKTFSILTVTVVAAGTGPWALFFENDQTENNFTRQYMRKETKGPGLSLTGSCTGFQEGREGLSETTDGVCLKVIWLLTGS